MYPIRIPPNNIRNIYKSIWFSIYNKIDYDYSLPSLTDGIIENLVIYDILDGTRTSLSEKPHYKIRNELEVPYYCLSFIYALSVLGAKSCVFLVHTSYNRARGKKEFERIENSIKKSYKPFKKFLKKYLIKCHCLSLNSNYEVIELLRDLENETRNGKFDAYFLFDYNDEWQKSDKGVKLIETLPEINVYIRHTKFQPSGGWIPHKMKKSSFLYSQNGTTFSNWRYDEIISLVCMALLTKILNENESLDKKYPSYNDIRYRYKRRELDLFAKTIYLRENPKKLFILGSPLGPIRVYY